MKIKPGTPLHASFAFGPDHIVQIGRLALDHGLAVLDYAPEFLTSGLVLNPRFQPPSTNLVRAADPRVFDGLHGVLADSLPDAWGDELMRRRAARSGIDYSALNVLDKLAVVGSRGMGALTYKPEFPESDEDSIDLDLLAHEALEVLEGRDSDVIAQLEQLGGSSGGARPKVLIAMNAAGKVLSGIDRIPEDFDAWIVKFRNSRDRVDSGPLEAAYAAMARAAGLNIPETKLISSNTGGAGYFATKRFDRGPHGTRHHVLSVAGLLDIDWRYPNFSYEAVLKATRFVTRQEAEVKEMFRRMVFNIIAFNRDDHTKQHAFLMDDAGLWTLAPAFDLTFSTGPAGEHYLTVDGVGTNINQKSVAAVAQSQGIDAGTVRDITSRVTEAVSQFIVLAGEYNVSQRTISEVSKTLDQQVKVFLK